MRESGKRNGRRALWWFMAMLMVAVGGMAGCATTSAGLAGGGARTLWQSREQFVKIEKQDKTAQGMAPANAHPADVPVERLRDVLASIEVRFDGKDKAVPLFYDEELDILSDKLHAGLAAAGSDEDVTFAIIGHYPVLLGLKERMVTTGRVFCRDGRLNIIFGDVHRSVKENEDRRLYPFLPGSRTVAHQGEWALTARSGGESFAMERPDWVTYPIVGSAAPVVAPTLRERGGTIPAATTAPSVSPPEKPVTTGRKSVEERLRTLNDLHDKKLITDEEYRAKRQEILNEL